MLRPQAECSEHHAETRKLLLKIMTIRSFNVLFLCTVIPHEAFLPKLISMRPDKAGSAPIALEVFQRAR